MTGSERDKFDDALDDLLATARWPEIPNESYGRLEASLPKRHPPAFPWTMIASMAAVLALAIGLIWTRMDAGNHPPISQINREPQPKIDQIQSRPANVAELAILMEPTPPRPHEVIAAKPAINIKSRTEAALAGDLNALQALMTQSPANAVQVGLTLLANRRPSSPAVLESMKQNRSTVEEELFRKLDDPKVAIRLAAARALGYLDGPIVTRRLATMVNENHNRREALAALMLSNGDDARTVVEEARQIRSLASLIESVKLQIGTF